jgi:hypothetical protein
MARVSQCPISLRSEHPVCYLRVEVDDVVKEICQKGRRGDVLTSIMR